MTINITNELELQQRWYQAELTIRCILCALLFSIPISSSLKSIMLVAGIFLLLATKINKASLNYLIKQPWVRAILVFLFIVLIECCWTPADWSEQRFVIEKHSKLIWLPLLTLGFADKKTRYWGLHAFLAAMVLICLVALGRSSGLLYSTEAPGSVFRNYIIIGHMMAFACYLSAYLAIKTPSLRLPYAGLFLLFSYEVLFISLGRTGFIIYFVLILLLMLQLLKKKQLILGFVLLLLTAGLALHFSTTMQQGVESLQSSAHEFQQGEKNTSLGFRLQFQQFAFKLFKENPILGNGTASLVYYFGKENPVPSWDKPLHEPHNQYWLIAAEYGLIGIVVYFILLFTLTMACLRLHEMKHIAIALLIPFIIGSFSDSLLFYSGSGYFFLTLMALCLGESVRVKS